MNMSWNRQKGYNKTGNLYENDRYGSYHMELYKKVRNESLIKIIENTFDKNKPITILEVGCGTGLSLERLSHEKCNHTIVGLDFSFTMLRQVIEKIKFLEKAPKITLGNAMQLPFKNKTFDMVFATRFIHQFKHDAKKILYNEFNRVTHENGAIVIEFYSRIYHTLRYFTGGRKGRSFESYFSHYPSKKEVQDIIKDRFEILPLRLAGARILYKLLGDKGLGKLSISANRFPLNAIVDEYFTLHKKCGRKSKLKFRTSK